MVELPVILVIEDDEQIQSLVEDALIEGGFEVASTASGEEAVTLLKSSSFIKERPVTYRALVTDINLKGGMNGWEVAKQAREIDPEFPVVYMTGAAAEQWGSNGVPNSTLLKKPFAPAQLVTAVSQLLNTGMPDNQWAVEWGGKSVFLVEDEALIRMMIVEMLEELGHRVVAEAGSIETAEPLARTSVFDLAVFDINVAGFNISPIAEIVAARSLPFVFVSGYGPAGRPALFADKPVLHKPFLIEHFADMINLAMGDK